MTRRASPRRRVPTLLPGDAALVDRIIRRAPGDDAAPPAPPATTAVPDDLPPGAVPDPSNPNLFHVETYETLQKKGARMARRNDDQGPVRITLERVPTRLGDMLRPIHVSGKIVPTVTSGRRGAPDAVSGIKVGTAKATLDDRESTPDAHRGHLMALELGGPDLPVNIVPQWAMFQANGVWRQAENAALAAAKDAAARGYDCYFELEVKYLRNASGQQPSRRRMGSPQGFTMTTRNVARADGTAEEPVVHFDGEQDRDERDWRNIDRLLTGKPRGRNAEKAPANRGTRKKATAKKAAAAPATATRASPRRAKQ